MKTSTKIKRAMHVLLVSTLIITSVIMTRNTVRNIKYMYGQEPGGKGFTCFFDMIQ